MSLALVTVIVAIAGLVLWIIRISSYTCQKMNPFPVLTAQPDFNWRETEPIKARPFKPKYNLTMGVCLYSVIETC